MVYMNDNSHTVANKLKLREIIVQDTDAMYVSTLDPLGSTDFKVFLHHVHTSKMMEAEESS